MGINTKAYLVLPKVIGALIMIPCLIVLSAFLGIWGGRTAANLSGIVASDIFDIGLRSNFKAYNVYFALSKAYTFAFIVSSIPAYYGYFVTGGALEIGRSSTTSVVVSCILILVADYGLAALLL
jgi:phospholipid/cholesterol/gamma-HCH transport system permease protein